MTDIGAALIEHLRGHASPILFVGAGLSRRYVGVENWEGLLKHFAEMTSRPYEYYRSKASGHLPAVATAIAEVFSDLWWDSPKFEESRKVHASSMSNPESALKLEVAHHLSGLSAKLPTEGPLAAELDLLRNAVVDAVITTNYDDILPTLFPSFKPFVGQDGLLFSSPQGVGELYQIHGSVKIPDSLVLTAGDYARFEQRDSYLAAKLMTIFVEHPIVFLGYSLSDDNVRSILRSIAGCLTQDNIGQLRDQLIFVVWNEQSEASITTSNIMFDDFILPVMQVQVPDFTAVFAALANLRRVFPAKLLRRLKEQVYELVLTDDPHHRLVVVDIDDATEDRDVDVVFGVGVRAKFGGHGYVGLTRDDLINDVLGNRNSYDAHEVVERALPHILSFPGNVPVYKYLRGAGVLDESGELPDSADVSEKIRKMAAKIRAGLPASAEICRKAPAVLQHIDSLADLAAAHGVAGVFNYGTCLSPEKVDAAELRTFLNDNRAV